LNGNPFKLKLHAISQIFISFKIDVLQNPILTYFKVSVFVNIFENQQPYGKINDTVLTGAFVAF